MKNTLLVAFLWLSAYMVQAQDTIHYFNKSYSADTINLLTSIGVGTNNGYYLIGSGSTLLNQTALFLIKTDLMGNQEWRVNIDVNDNHNIPSLELGRRAFISKDSCLVFTYTKGVLSNGFLNRTYLVKVKLDGTIAWSKQSLGTGVQRAIQVIETYDGRFTLFGSLYYENDTSKHSLRKKNTTGVVQWHHKYVLDDDPYNPLLQQTHDGGYIFSTSMYNNDTKYDIYTVKIDSLGVVQWSNKFGGQYYDAVCDVTLLANNQYLLTSRSCLANNFDGYMRLTKLNNLGEIIWDSIYYTMPQLSYSNSPIFFLSDSSFVTSLNFRSDITGRISNWFTYFDLQGNILSRHEYSLNPNEDVYIQNLRRTPDGGFMMVGHDYAGMPPKGYLVKTDSLGRSCSWVGCDSIAYNFANVVLPWTPIEVEVQMFEVYPNPAQDYLSINNLSSEQNVTFVLYDVLGRVVLQQTLNSPSFGGSKGEATISTKHLPSGIYLYQIINPQNQTLQYGKVSIVR